MAFTADPTGRRGIFAIYMPRLDDQRVVEISEEALVSRSALCTAPVARRYKCDASAKSGGRACTQLESSHVNKYFDLLRISSD